MNQTHQSTTYVSESSLSVPANPKHFEIVSAPHGQNVGASTIILLTKDDKIVGDLTSIVTIPNVVNTLTGYRGRSHLPLQQGDHLTVVITLYRYHSLLFVDNFGWVGIDPDTNEKKKVLDSYSVTVVYANEIKLSDLYYAYDQLCLRRTS